jgi:hypothetical protein
MRLTHLRKVRRSQIMMTSGLLASFLGTQVLDGAVSGMVALGVFPVLWIPLYKTLTEVEDALAVVIAPIIGKKVPGRVLVFAESCDVILSIALLVCILVFPQTMVAALIVYLAFVSILPLLVDLAEEFYLNDLGQIDSTAAIRGNTMIAVGTIICGAVVGKSLGALTATQGIIIGVTVNIVLSICAVVLRTASRSQFEPEHEVENMSDKESLNAALRNHFFPTGVKVLVDGGILSPWVSGVATIASAVTGIYVLLWISGSGQAGPTRLSLLFVLVGSLSAVLPLISGRIMKGPSQRVMRYLRILSVLGILGYGSTLIVALLYSQLGIDRLWAAPGIIVATATGGAITFTVSTLRQMSLERARFKAMIGWVFSIAALCGLAGSWVAYALNAVGNPVLVLVLATLSSTCLALIFSAGKLPAKSDEEAETMVDEERSH